MVNNEINAIKDRICMTVMPKRIYLFGSFAKDTYNEDSDYDFYVVVPETGLNCLRKHISLFAEFENAPQISWLAMKHLLMSGPKRIPLKEL